MGESIEEVSPDTSIQKGVDRCWARLTGRLPSAFDLHHRTALANLLCTEGVRDVIVDIPPGKTTYTEYVDVPFSEKLFGLREIGLIALQRSELGRGTGLIRVKFRLETARIVRERIYGETTLERLGAIAEVRYAQLRNILIRVAGVTSFRRVFETLNSAVLSVVSGLEWRRDYASRKLLPDAEQREKLRMFLIKDFRAGVYLSKAFEGEWPKDVFSRRYLPYLFKTQMGFSGRLERRLERSSIQVFREVFGVDDLAGIGIRITGQFIELTDPWLFLSRFGLHGFSPEQLIGLREVIYSCIKSRELWWQTRQRDGELRLSIETFSDAVGRVASERGVYKNGVFAISTEWMFILHDIMKRLPASVGEISLEGSGVFRTLIVSGQEALFEALEEMEI